MKSENLHKKSKKTNMFLNDKNDKHDRNNTHQKDSRNNLKKNIFSNEIGKNIASESKPKREIDIKDDEIFPSLIETPILNKKSKTKQSSSGDYVSYLSIAKQEESTKKDITYDVDPGWVHLFRGDDNKIHFLYGPTTEKCLELEKKEYELKLKKERNELYTYLEELEYERHLRKELYKDICNFYDPRNDKYYTKEEDIVIYTLNDMSDSDTEGSMDYQDDYDNINNNVFD